MLLVSIQLTQIVTVNAMGPVYGGSDELATLQTDGDFDNTDNVFDNANKNKYESVDFIPPKDENSLSSGEVKSAIATTTESANNNNDETTIKTLAMPQQSYTTVRAITILPTTTESERDGGTAEKEEKTHDYDYDHEHQQQQPHYSSAVEHHSQDSLESESEYIAQNITARDNEQHHNHNNAIKAERYKLAEDEHQTQTQTPRTETINENLEPTAILQTTADIEHNRNVIDENAYFNANTNESNGLDAADDGQHNHNDENDFISSSTKSIDLDDSYVTKNSNLNNNFNNFNNFNNNNNHNSTNRSNINNLNNINRNPYVSNEHEIDDISNQAILTSTSTTTELPSLVERTTPTLIKSTASTLTILTTKIKQSKQIEVTEMRSADKILSAYVEDIYLRSPIAILVNQSPESLIKTQRLWQSTLRPNAAMDFILLSYNVTGGIIIIHHYYYDICI